jgi:DNA repair protein RadC
MIRSDFAEFRAAIKRWNEIHPEMRIRGVGAAKTAELLAAFEFVRRGYEKCTDALTCLEDAAAMFFDVLGEGERQELFMVLPLDSQNRPLRKPEIVTRGLTGKTAADAREVFSRVLKWGAESLIVAHNHPGGDIEPSADDVAATRALVAAGKTVGVELADHLVLGDRPNFTSLRERDLLH